MQTGFAALEVGSTLSKNAKNILLKNLVDNCIGSIIWWLVGYSIAFGEDIFGVGFVGGGDFKYIGGYRFDEN